MEIVAHFLTDKGIIPVIPKEGEDPTAAIARVAAHHGVQPSDAKMGPPPSEKPKDTPPPGDGRGDAPPNPPPGDNPPPKTVAQPPKPPESDSNDGATGDDARNAKAKQRFDWVGRATALHTHIPLA